MSLWSATGVEGETEDPSTLQFPGAEDAIGGAVAAKGVGAATAAGEAEVVVTELHAAAVARASPANAAVSISLLVFTSPRALIAVPLVFIGTRPVAG
jgi:hypothetical protein